MATRGTTLAGKMMADALGGLGGRRRSLQADVGTLAAVPLFARLSKRHLRKLAEQADELHYRDGRIIVQAGQPGRAFFVIVEGGAKVYSGKLASGRPKARLGPGDFFGEMAVLDGSPRSATVVSDGAVTVLRLTRSAFLKMIGSEPSVAVEIMAGLAERLRQGAPSE
jgi:CRP/FNR family cyclic AMP-dependent transcriptional regulator